MNTPEEQSERKPAALLLGSTYPLSLVRRPVRIAPASLDELRDEVARKEVFSFWGHLGTAEAARNTLGIDVLPATSRPALELTPEGLPSLHAKVFAECWILSPELPKGFRPGIGQEVPAEQILGWQVLKLEWEPQT